MIKNKLQFQKLFAACVLTPPNTFKSFVEFLTCTILSSVVPLLIALAVALFIWGVVQYLMGANEEAKRKKGRDFMLWGIIALTVMVSVWGLVRVLGHTFGVSYVIPQVQIQE